MKKSLKDKWITSLRSGDYKQGQGRLRNNKDEHCCLGVLCRVSGLKGRFDLIEDCYEFDGNPDSLSGALQERFGLDNKEISHLLDLNDGHYGASFDRWVPGKSFTEIADWIEKNVPGT